MLLYRKSTVNNDPYGSITDHVITERFNPFYWGICIVVGLILPVSFHQGYHHLILGRWWWPLTHGHMALHEKYTTWRIGLTWCPLMETRGLILRRTRSSIGVRLSTRVHVCRKTTTDRGISHSMRVGLLLWLLFQPQHKAKTDVWNKKVRRHSLHWFQRDQNELDPQRFDEEDIENDVMSTSMMFYPCRYHWSLVSCSLTGHVKWQWRWYSTCAMDILSSVLQQEIVIDLE